MSAPISSDLLDKILALATEAEATGNYETAYHLLMGALHEADSRGDTAGVEQVGEAANEQEGRLEALDPPHHLSSAAARVRGTVAVYRSLHTHIDAVRIRLRARIP